MPVTPPVRDVRPLTPKDHSHNDHQKEDDENKKHDAGSNDVGGPLLLLHLGPLLSAGTAFMRLDPQGSRACETTHQAFTGGHGSKQRTGGHANGVADSISPGNQVTVVDHTAFPRSELIFDTGSRTTKGH